MVAVNQLFNLCRAQRGVALGQGAKLHQFGVFNIVTIFFSKQILKNPPITRFARFGQNDGAMHVVVQPLLKHPAAQVVRLSKHHLLYGSAQLVIEDMSLLYSFVEPRCFEYSPC